MDKIDILQITPFYPPGFAFGGPTVSSGELARGLARIGHQVTTLASNRNGEHAVDLPRRLVDPSGRETIYCRTWPGRFLYSPELAPNLRHFLPLSDVAILTGGTWNYFFLTGCRSSRKFQRPYVVYPRGNFSPWAISYKQWGKKVWWQLFDKINFQKAAAVVALTREEASQVRHMGISSRLEVIPNGVNIGDYQEAMTRQEIEQLFPQLKDRRWLLFLGRLHPIKGLDRLLAAFATVRRDFRDSVLVLAGPNEGSYRRKVEGMVGALNIDEAVCFTGMVSGALKNGLLHHSEVFCLTSYSEGMPMGVLEAMACGLPVLLTPECRMPEVVEYQAGLVQKGDPKEIAKGLATMLRDKKQHQQMRINAINLVKQKFTWERVCEQTSQLLMEIM